MRTLKRTLCLALVLVMMVGLLAVGASAVKLDDYKDKDQIVHKEAVAVLSAINVLEGDANGFRPNDTLTRAEGAKIITVMHATQGAGVSSFTDMGAAAWAQPYVAYCEASGIIGGYGDGTFGPQNALTAAQFAKMLLCALGFDASLEGLVDAAWEINVVKLVNKINLAAGIGDMDWSAPITRDNAAQMAFNALKAAMVEYNGNLKVTTSDGTKVEVGANAQAIQNNSYDYRAEGILYYDDEDRVPTDGIMQFIENFFPTIKLHIAEDDYGLKEHFWFKGTSRTDNTYRDSKLIAQAVSSIILKTYTTNVALVSGDTLYKDGNFGKDNIRDFLWVYENGHLRTMALPTKGSSAFVLSGYAGATVMLVDDDPIDGVADTVVVKYPLLAKVTGITKAEDSRTKEREVELSVYVPTNAEKTNYTTVDTKFATESFSKGEFVLVYPDMKFPYKSGQSYYTINPDTAIIELTTVDSAIGTLEKVNLAGGAVNALTSSGVRYSVAAADLAAKGPETFVVGTKQYNKYGLNREITLYTSNGYVMGVNTTATPLADYVYVIAVGPGTTDLVTGVTSYTAAYAKQDGTTATIKTTSTGIEHKWCIMTPRGDSATFTAPAGLTQVVSITGLSSTQPNLGQYASNNKTNFVIRSGSGSGTTVKGYAGISAVPKFTDSASAYVLVDDTKAAAAFVDYSGKAAADTAGNALFFLTDMPDGTVAEGPATYYTFNTMDTKGNISQVSVASDATIGQANGTYETIVWTDGLEGAGLYVPETNEKGIITKLTIPSTAAPSTYVLGSGLTGKVSAGDGVISVKPENAVGSGSFTVAPDAAIYRFDFLGNKKTVDSLEDLQGRSGTLALIAAPGPGKIATIFFMG